MRPVIVHVVQHLKPGGIESFALEFQRAAHPYFDVHIIALEKHKITSYWNNIGGFDSFIHQLNKKPGWQANIFMQLKAFFEKVNPLYVHTHHIGPLIYGGIAARLANVEHLIHTEHDAWHLAGFKPRLLQNVIMKMVQPIFVADANFVAEQVHKLIPSLHPIVITNGIDTKKFKPSTLDKKTLLKQVGLPTTYKYIGCAARLESVKSHDVLLKAVAKLPNDIGLLLAGTGSLKAELETLAKKLNIQERVFFLGHIDDMTSFYPLIDVFCLSSSNEGLPLSPLEAQACGIPAVLTDVGACKEAICSKTGSVVKPNDPQLLAEAIQQALTPKTSISPRLFVERNRSIDKMINQYVSLTQSELRWKLC